MKLIWAIVQKDDAGALIDALTKDEYRVTRINTAGGFLKESNATVVLAVEDYQVERVMSIIERNCQTRVKQINPLPPIMEPGEFYVPYPVEVEVGGATVMVLDLADFRRL
ncbi:MAG: cyclic-di-AMP receptor [Bacteroidetes bacterium]|nr:cyclic-di-AMP receptor [Bacteroidota bacterium]MCL5024979.1 cyclic-di-AMP receptor [Chloroflexota bacterium]